MRNINLLLITLLSLALTSCEFVGGLIEAGFWAGVIIASIFWGILIFLFKKIF